MGIYKNLILIYGILPYIKNCQNKSSLLLSILLGFKKYKLKINNEDFIFLSTEYTQLFYLLELLEISFYFKCTRDKKFIISLDGQNEFMININNQNIEDKNLLELLAKGAKKSANFITYDSKISLREKEIKIYEKNGKKIVETHEGIKFYLDSIHPHNSIVETFIDRYHQINSSERFDDKIVLDVGAECGDTALFYANLGAKVYSFEPIKENFNDLKKNLELNPLLEKNIIAINAGIGKDETLNFFKDPISPNLGASFVYNKRDNAIIEHVEGMSLDTVLEKFEINEVELLKLDCKGCEFFLSDSVLQKIKRIKIEYGGFHKSKNAMDLIQQLKKAGFTSIIYRNSATRNISNRNIGNIYSVK